MNRKQNFRMSVQSAVRDDALRAKVRKSTSTALLKRKATVDELPEWEELRTRAHEIKKTVIENLRGYTEEFEQNARRAGCIVHHAQNAADANRIVKDLLRDARAVRVVKSKSMVTEEIGLNHALAEAGVRVLETDLGEYILQLAGEPPSHITAPAMHKSRADIGKLFAEKLGIPYTDDPQLLTSVARERLRDEFLNASAGISGVNFACADTGTIVVVENEANARMCTVLPEIHIAVMSIEKIIPSIDDIPLFLKLLSRSASGQRATSYVSLINGPRGGVNPDGPGEVHIVVLDGGRTILARHPEWKEALYCIKCGACMNICPVYQTIGGHAYGSVYPGPIGSVLSPLLFGMKTSKDLPFASSLCGACTDICPVKIDLHHLLFRERREVVDRGLKSRTERMMMHMWRWIMRSPGRVEAAGRVGWFLQRLFGNKLHVPGWTPRRRFPKLAGKSFRKLMRERM